MENKNYYLGEESSQDTSQSRHFVTVSVECTFSCTSQNKLKTLSDAYFELFHCSSRLRITCFGVKMVESRSMIEQGGPWIYSYHVPIYPPSCPFSLFHCSLSKKPLAEISTPLGHTDNHGNELKFGVGFFFAGY